MKFGTCLIDPPYHYKMWTPKGESRSPQVHYRTMRQEELLSLPLSDIMATDSALLLWCPVTFLPDGFALIKAWGFEYSTMVTWVKVSKATGDPAMGTGYRFRNCTEQLLLGTRGSIPRTKEAVLSAILAPRREHSRKPDEQYRYAEIFPGPYIEVFARPCPAQEGRKDWTFIGNEITGNDVRTDLASLAGQLSLF